MLLALPGFSLAEVPAENQITDFSVLICNILRLIWPAFIGLAIIMFFVAGFFFLGAHGDPGKITIARSFLIWGVVGVIVAIMGFSIVQIVATALNIRSGIFSCTP